MLERSLRSREEWSSIISVVFQRWDAHTEPLSERQMYRLIEEVYFEGLESHVASEQLRALHYLLSPLRQWITRREEARASKSGRGTQNHPRKQLGWFMGFLRRKL